MSRSKKFALITGCGKGGIGEALACEYSRVGIHAIATILPSEASEHLVQAGLTWFYLDVTSEESIRELKQQVVKLTGGMLDILVNNAGICYTMTAIDTDITAVERMFDVNIFGPIRMVHHFHSLIIASAGTIVNIGSVGGIVPYVYGASYNATKAGLHHWSNTLRVEMAPLSVKVLTVISGEIGTNILRSDRDRELPEDSYFSPLAPEFKRHVQRSPETTNRFSYAAQVVSQSLRPDPPAWLWYGKTTRIVRFFDMFAWRTIWDCIFWFMFNFGKLKAAHKGRPT
ncbi:NAD(P)-binding protein [Whalleya microplaca]|nr:NAD(P)-binding protein [Whalleya microplaca]